MTENQNSPKKNKIEGDGEVEILFMTMSVEERVGVGAIIYEAVYMCVFVSTLYESLTLSASVMIMLVTRSNKRGTKEFNLFFSKKKKKGKKKVAHGG